MNPDKLAEGQVPKEEDYVPGDSDEARVVSGGGDVEGHGLRGAAKLTVDCHVARAVAGESWPLLI